MTSSDEVREAVIAALEELPGILDMTIEEYFSKIDIYRLAAVQVEALDRTGHHTIHEFMVEVAEADSDAKIYEDYEFLSELNREPINHFIILNILYEARIRES